MFDDDDEEEDGGGGGKKKGAATQFKKVKTARKQPIVITWNMLKAVGSFHDLI